MSCYWIGHEQPRMIRGRHDNDCKDETCAGCLPCTQPHCRVCGHDHTEHTCPNCLADTRATIAEILRLCASLPDEAIHRGVNSEAMNLLGPTADPEALGHMRASRTVGRIPADWLEDADHELHPLLVLGTWQEAYCEAFDHDEPNRITIEGAASYLERNLTYAAEYPDVPFEDCAGNLKACRRHIESVLRDGVRDIESDDVACLTCGMNVRRRMTPDGIEDNWWCRGCRRHLAPHEFYLAAAHAARLGLFAN